MQKNNSGRVGVMLISSALLFKRLVNVITPLFLVRFLDVAQYGQYRFFWLIVLTVMLIIPMESPQSLLYFLPRKSKSEKALFVSQTLLYLTLTGMAGSLLVGPWGPLNLSEKIGIESGQYLISVFLFLWAVSSLMDILPSANQDYKWQSFSIVLFTLIRNAVIVTAAAATRDLYSVYLSLSVFALLKLLILIYFCVYKYGWKFFRIDLTTWKEQLRFALPFGFTSILSNAQSRIEQWIVVIIFPISSFAIFSIARNLDFLIKDFRKSIGQVVFPKMSKSDTKGDKRRALELNNRANLVASVLVFPMVCFFFAFANPIITTLYTEKYLDAVSITRIYLIGMALSSVDVSHLLMIYKLKSFAVKSGIALIGVATLFCYIGGIIFGLEGLAAGSVMAFFVGKIVRFAKIASVINIPVRSLQRWSILSSYFGVSLLSTFLSWIAFTIVPLESELIKLIIASALFLGLYLSLLYILGRGDIIKVMIGKGDWQNV